MRQRRTPPSPPPRSGEGGERQPLPPPPAPSPKRRGGRKATPPPPKPPSPKRRGGEKQPLPQPPSPKRRGGASRESGGVSGCLLSSSPSPLRGGGRGRGSSLPPPLRFGEGAGGRGSCLPPPLRFGEGAGGRGKDAPSSSPKRPPQHLRLQPAKKVPPAGLQVHQADHRRAEQHRIDLVEIAVIALENIRERRPVIGRGA